MNRTEVIDAYFAFCKQAGYEPHQVILSAGAALVMFEERETTADLDCDVPAHDYAQFVCQRPSGERRSSLGAFFDYDDVVSLHAFPEGTGVSQHATPKGLVYTYSWMALVEQKIKLVEMPDRKPEKIPRDLEELDNMVLGLAFAGDVAGVKELIERAGRAKANRV
jgi:hypothetical protein